MQRRSCRLLAARPIACLDGSQIPDGMVIVLRLTAPKNGMMLLSVPLAKGDGSQVCSGLAAGGRWIRTLGPPSEGQRFSRLLFPNIHAPPPPSKTLAGPSSSCFFQFL